jgi:heptosyltransferase I
MDILFVKTSSLGDIIHHMPAITDARRTLPDARSTWVVEEAFAPLVRLHPAVDEVIPVAVRRWRGALHHLSTWREMGATIRAIRAREYDKVIDCQGLLRTALITKLARGRSHGYDVLSIRESLASHFYDRHHKVGWDLHAVVRNRKLTGLALGYTPQGPIDYGLDRAALAGAVEGGVETEGRRQALLLHATSRANKEWPETHWVALGRALAERGLVPLLPYGSNVERERAERLAANIPGARVPARRPIDEIARLVASSSIVVGVDTGLLHLAAALGVPLVGIFIGTEPGQTGPAGTGPIAVTGSIGQCPNVAEVLAAVDGLSVMGGRSDS